MATSILADYAADDPQVLAQLLLDADEKQYGVIFPKFKKHAEHSLPLLLNEIQEKRPAGVTSGNESWERLAKRQANAAATLLRINQPTKVWPLLKRSPPDNPTVRSFLIHRLSSLGVDAGVVISRWHEEPDGAGK